MDDVQFIESLGTLNIKPGDVIVVKLNRPVHRDTQQRIQQTITDGYFRGMRIKTLVLQPGMDIGVIREGSE
jgi:hypothetical protein